VRSEEDPGDTSISGKSHAKAAPSIACSHFAPSSKPPPFSYFLGSSRNCSFCYSRSYRQRLLAFGHPSPSYTMALSASDLQVCSPRHSVTCNLNNRLSVATSSRELRTHSRPWPNPVLLPRRSRSRTQPSTRDLRSPSPLLLLPPPIRPPLLYLRGALDLGSSPLPRPPSSSIPSTCRPWTSPTLARTANPRLSAKL
jgi:hypothetical protein